MYKSSVTFLNFLFVIVYRNRNDKKPAFSPLLRNVSLWCYLVGGSKLSNFLYQNFGLASPETIRHWLHDKYNPIIEGEVRVEDLNKFVNQNGFCKVLAISEDATAIKPDISYDAATDSILGLVKPIDRNTGLPFSPNIFEASTIGKVQNYADNHQLAKYVNIIMARPLAIGAPSFPLSVYATNCSFTGEDVKARVKSITEDLIAEGFLPVSFSTDAAAAYLKADKDMINFGNNQLSTLPSPEWAEWWACGFDVNMITPLQDCLHEDTKIRNRVLSGDMVVGNQKVSVSYLKVITKHLGHIQKH